MDDNEQDKDVAYLKFDLSGLDKRTAKRVEKCLDKIDRQLNGRGEE